MLLDATVICLHMPGRHVHHSKWHKADFWVGLSRYSYRCDLNVEMRQSQGQCNHPIIPIPEPALVVRVLLLSESETSTTKNVFIA